MTTTQQPQEAQRVEFAELYSTHYHRIAGQLYGYLGDHAEAQDLTQEAFCRALDRWSTVGTYDDAPACVRKWPGIWPPAGCAICKWHRVSCCANAWNMWTVRVRTGWL